MKNTIFSLVSPNRVRKSNFDLSHERKLTCNMGELVPILVQEVVPGDKFKIDTQSLIRFSPLVSPVMHRINAYFHFFYVPNRIIFPEWEKLITGEQQIEVPSFDITRDDHAYVACSLADHMGLPIGVHFGVDPQKINTLPFRAYAKIYNDYYRDENFCNELDIEDDEALIKLPLKRRAWAKDYFTSALPWAQKGNPVTVDVDLERNSPSKAFGEVASDGNVKIAETNTPGEYVVTDVNDSALAIHDVESAEFSVESLRLAERLQRFLERNARAGTRYVEHLLAHWGIVSSDSRLQRAEYIGGGVSPVIVSEVLSNSMTLDPASGTPEVVNPVGQMAGHAISVGRTNQAYKFVEEHGYIIGIMSIMPEPAYFNQGIPRMYSKLTQLDFYFPEFATLGEQAILKKELRFDEASGAVYNEAEFGYQQRWAEYKYQRSTVHGEFLEDFDYWHLARDIQAPVVLGKDFIECLPSNRIFADVASKTTLYVQVYNKVWASRPMPYESIPY